MLNLIIVQYDPQYSQLLPPLPHSGCILCVCPDENIVRHGILQVCANEKFAVSFIPSFAQNEITKHKKNSSIDVWLDEENIMVNNFSKIKKGNKFFTICRQFIR